MVIVPVRVTSDSFLFTVTLICEEPFFPVVGETTIQSLSFNLNETQEDEFLPADSAELYDNKTIAQKLFIVSAGVIMNIVFAIILVMFCAVCFHKLPTSNQNLYVDSFVAEKTSNIENFNVKKGDKIHKVNGIKVNSLYQLTFLFYSQQKMDYGDSYGSCCRHCDSGNFQNQSEHELL